MTRPVWVGGLPTLPPETTKVLPLLFETTLIPGSDAEWMLGKTTYTDIQVASGNASPIKPTR